MSKLQGHFFTVSLKTGGNLREKIRNLFFYHVVRRLKKPENFFKFTTKGKSDYCLVGHHNSCTITIQRNLGEKYKPWMAFCARMVFLSRNNK